MPVKFKKGNKMWERRSKHGRDKLFASPQLLWQTFCDYCQDCIDNPIMEAKPMVVDKMVEMIEVPHPIPFTLAGFAVFIGCNVAWFRQFRADPNKCTDDFSTVFQSIDAVMYSQKFNGAAVGTFNGNIIARDLGLADKTIAESYNTNLNVEATEAERAAIIEQFKKDF